MTQYDESIGGADRMLYRNASTTPMIMRESPFGGWLKARESYRGVGFQGNIATQWGQKHEDSARKAAAIALGLDLAGPRRVMDGDYAASLDDITTDGNVILEIKCPYQGKKSKIWRSVMDFADPSYYHSQMQHQLMLTKAESNILFVFDAESGDHCYCEVVPNKAYQNDIRKEWDKFWTWKDTDEPDPEDSWILVASPSWHDEVRRYLDAKKRMDDAKKDVDASKKLLIEMAEGDRCRGAGVTLIRTERAGSVDYSKIPQLEGVDLEQYRSEPSEVWTLTTEKVKK